jgi:hypothetical protein
VAGDDEVQARAALDEMQLRITEGPYAVLGLSEYASTDDVRAAFLALTKQYHPARFGRMASEIQKYSNEVFLGIKAAHDQLQRVLGGSLTRPGGTGAPFSVDTQRGTNAPQNVRRTDHTPPPQRTTGSIPRQPTPPPFASATDRSAPMNTPPRGLSRPMNTPSQPMQRPSSPPMNTPAHGLQRPVTPGPGQRPSAPVVPRTGTPAPTRTTPASGVPVQRSSTPMAAHQRPSTPPGRPSTPGGRAQNPSTPPLNRMPPPAADFNPPTIRHSGAPTQTATSQPAVPFDERSALRECMMLLNDRNWTGARVALHNLAAKVPQAKTYRALLCYARGREAQAAGRTDEAQLEYQRALQLDPALDLAGQALAELNRRR